MDRRTFLSGVAAAAGTVMLSRCSLNSTHSSVNVTNSELLFSSQNGRLDIALTAQERMVPLGQQQAQRLIYGEQQQSPILELRPGDAVRIQFTNRLAQPTNLHFHGLMIPPTGKADNVFRTVQPGEMAEYEFELALDHPAVTAWYHPHYHGLVAEQVFGGLAGLILVRGELDNLPEIQAAQESLLVLQDVELTRNGAIADPAPMYRMWGREGSLLTVNGQINPTMTVPEAGLARLRLLNASASRIYRLQLEDHPFYLIATDGGAVAEPIELEELLLAPGERADVLIQGNREPGTYRLLNLPYDRGFMSLAESMMGGSGMGMMRGHEKLLQVNREPQTLATIQYGKRDREISLPKQLIPVETLPTAQQTRQFVLDHGMSPHSGSGFLINNKAFDHHRIDTQVQLGTTEDWEIINNAGLDHPFHLHAYPFQVISRDGQPAPYAAWKDTVLVKAYETARIRIPFRQFSGKTVYHCHILDHEDLGMMGIVETVS